MAIKIVTEIESKKIIDELMDKNDIDGYINSLIKLDILRRNGAEITDEVLNSYLSKYDNKTESKDKKKITSINDMLKYF